MASKKKENVNGLKILKYKSEKKIGIINLKI